MECDLNPIEIEELLTAIRERYDGDLNEAPRAIEYLYTLLEEMDSTIHLNRVR